MNHRTHWRNVTIVALSLALPAWSAIAQQQEQEQDQQFDPLAEQQSEPQPAVSANSDVPSRVARLNYFDGTVTFQPAGGNEWAYAELNRPMTSGDQVWVDNGGRSELHIGSTALRLGQQTAVSIVNLDDQNAQLKLAQGTLNTRLRNLPAGQSFEVDTPNVALQADGPGSYRVEAAPDGTSTTVTVRDGSLTAYGDTGSVQIGAGQQLTFTGTNLQEAGGGTAPPPDAFEAWAVSRDRAEDASVSARYVSRDVPGYQDLDANGTWEASPDYGQVWVPRVAAGWAPYHEGHWAWVAPWGWTWVDDAPWGFAPFHYGRWAYYRNNWAWVPGPVVVTEPPCYAPALVAFVGGGNGGPGWGVSLTVGAVAAGVAWLPLGPGEPWRPAYHYSPRYYNRVNYVNHTTIVNNVHNTYINRGAPRAITGMPANQFVRGQGAGRYGQTLRPQQIARNSIGAGAPSIAPVRQSFGGGLRPANFRPPQTAGARPVIATRNAPTPFAYRDSLAQRFAKSGGRVQGAGQPVVRTAPPANFARIANAPGQPARGAAQPAFRVVPAERRPMPAQANRGGTPNGIPPNQVREGQQRGPQGPGQPQAQTGQRPGQFSGQTPGQAPGQTPGDLRPGQSQFQPGQRPGQTEADQRRDAQPIQGGVRPGQPARPGQQQVNPINGEHQPAQAGRPGEAPVQGQMPRENGVPHPPDRAQTGRAGEQPGNTPQRGERGQMQGQPQQEQQRGQQQAEQQRAQQNEQQRAQQAEQQRSQQQQGQQQAAQQRAQQAEQQRPQQQDAQQQAAQQQRAQQAEQQRSQQQQGQQQAAQQQRAQQADQQRSQQQEAQQQAAQQQRAQQAEQQRAQQQQAQQQAAQQQRTQQAEQQRSQQQEAQQQAAQQQRAQQAEQQRSQQQQAQQQAAQQQRAQQQQAQQQAAQQQRAQQAEQQRAQQQQAQQQAAQQQAQQRAQQQQAEQQQRQQAAAQQMQNQQRQQQMQMQQQQQQQRRAEPPHPGSARDSQRSDQQHG